MIANPIDEDIKLEAMQRNIWHSSRRQSSFSVFEKSQEIDPFTSHTSRNTSNNRGQGKLPPQTCTDVEIDDEFLEIQDIVEKKLSVKSPQSGLILNASELNDLPAKYIIHPVESHQFPVIGVYVDKRVIPGFKYRIRPLPNLQENQKNKKYLFGGRALVLKTIGRGYTRRFTFESDQNCLNNNENYFWSDNSPEGYAFELEAISEGDKFTLFDVNHEAQGTVEIMKVENHPSRKIPTG